MRKLYINYNCGVPKISFTRDDGAAETTMSKMIAQYESKCGRHTFVSVDDFIDSELKKLEESDICFIYSSEISEYIFGEADFLDFAFNALDLDHTDYPDLRDEQNDLIRRWECDLDE